MEIRGIPAHSEGILMGHEVAKSQVVNQTHATSLELCFDKSQLKLGMWCIIKNYVLDVINNLLPMIAVISSDGMMLGLFTS